MKFLLKLTGILFFCLCIVSCSEDTDSIESQENEGFYLKNPNGSIVLKIEPELIRPIYKDLIATGKTDEAESFLINYNTNGEFIGDLPKIEKPSVSLKTGNSKANPSFYYGIHLQGSGWQYGNDNSVNELPNYYTFGTTGQSRRLEAFYLILNGINICYESHLQSIGWNQGVKCNGAITGTTGQSRRMEAIKIRIDEGKGFVLYQSHLQGIGWESDWKYNGAVSGTTGQSRRLEAFRVQFYLY